MGTRERIFGRSSIGIESSCQWSLASKYLSWWLINSLSFTTIVIVTMLFSDSTVDGSRRRWWSRRWWTRCTFPCSRSSEYYSVHDHHLKLRSFRSWTLRLLHVLAEIRSWIAHLSDHQKPPFCSISSLHSIRRTDTFKEIICRTINHWQLSSKKSMTTCRARDSWITLFSKTCLRSCCLRERTWCRCSLNNGNKYKFRPTFRQNCLKTLTTRRSIRRFRRSSWNLSRNRRPMATKRDPAPWKPRRSSVILTLLLPTTMSVTNWKLTFLSSLRASISPTYNHRTSPRRSSTKASRTLLLKGSSTPTDPN